MKVTMIAKEFPPHIYGGAGVHLKNLSHELSKLMEVEVRCFGEQSHLEKSFKVKGYKGWDQLKCNKKFYPVLETLSINLLTMCDEIDSDIVHTHTWYGHFAGFLAKTLYNLPFVATSHSLEPLRPWKEGQLGKGYKLSTWMERIGIEATDKIIAVSKLMKEDLVKYFNIPEDKIVVIHNGIDLNIWKYTPISDNLKKQFKIKDEYVLFIGRPTPQKGMEYLIDAADDIDGQIIMGAVGADTKEYEERMMEKAIKKINIVWIHKLLKEEEYLQLYSGARVFVCPSIYEPFGIINLEAMACGIPVVASAVGGIKEVVVNEKTGLLVEPANPKQLAEAVNRLLKNKELAKKYGENGRKRVEEKFSWSYMARQTKKVYEAVINQKKIKTNF